MRDFFYDSARSKKSSNSSATTLGLALNIQGLCRGLSADPESFFIGGPTFSSFFKLMRGSNTTKSGMAASKTPFKLQCAARFRWHANDGPTLLAW